MDTLIGLILVAIIIAIGACGSDTTPSPDAMNDGPTVQDVSVDVPDVGVDAADEASVADLAEDVTEPSDLAADRLEKD